MVTGVDRGLRWALVLVLIAAVGVLIMGTVAAQRGAPPIPARALAANGVVVYTGQEIVAGKAVFQRADLMDFGTLYGNGAYYGPDWGTDYLNRETGILRDLDAAARFGIPYAQLTSAEQAEVAAAVRSELRTNRYQDGVLTLTSNEVTALAQLKTHYRSLFIDGDKQLGLAAGTVRSAGEADQLTTFLSWVAWTSVTDRPGQAYSYTNNWPYDPATGNVATDGMRWWTAGSLVLLAIAAGAIVWFFRRFILDTKDPVQTPAPAAAPIESTPSQRSVKPWLLLVPMLILVQGLAGAAMAHYYADRTSFFGIDLSQWLPFQVLKAWHLQLAIAWVAAAWIAAGLYLAPIVRGREPSHQRVLNYALLGAVVAVVVGSLAGLWLGVKANLGASWFWIGNQGLEYIQLGRAFQIALFAGLALWALILARAFWPALRRRHAWGSVEALLLYSGAGIAGVYLFGMQPLTGVMDSATMTDYWRWWVVHLWVENVFEFFTVAVIGYALLTMGLLSRRMVERTVYFELILILGSGIVGTGHHYYFAGEPAVWLGLGAMFSALEVIPLGLMLWRAWGEHRAIRAAGEAFPQRIAFGFFTSAAVWNLLGAGVIGLAVNPPLWNYYEHGQFLTLAHAHAALMGTFGMLAIGLVYFAARGLAPATVWSDRLGTWSLRLFNSAIVLWLVLNLLPIGIAQLATSVQSGYFASRSLDFYSGWTAVQWLRLPGDLAFLLAAAIMLADLALKLVPRARQITIRARTRRAAVA